MKTSLRKSFKGIAFAMLFLFTITSTIGTVDINAVDSGTSKIDEVVRKEIIAYDFDITLSEVDKLDQERIYTYSKVEYDSELKILTNTVKKELGEYEIVFADKENDNITKEIKINVVENFNDTADWSRAVRASATGKTWINYGYSGKIGNYSPYGQMSIPYIDGKEAFCMEPHVLFNTGATYTINNVSLSTEWIINDIIYYGFHKNGAGVKNYAFTQIAVWNYLTTGGIGGPNFSMTYGDTSGFDTYLNNLQVNLNSHNKMPSFNGKTYDVNVGDTLFVSDTNNISNIGSFSNNKVKKVSGGIEIGPFTATDIGSKNVTYSKNFTGYGRSPLVYNSGSSQKVMVSGDPYVLSGAFNIKIVALDSKIELTKTSAESGEVAQGAIFGIYKLNSTTDDFEPYINKNITQEIDEEVDLVLNNNNEAEVENVEEDFIFPLEEHHYVSSKGKITLNNVPLGKFALKEIVSPEGHVLNDEYIPFEVTGDGADINLDFPNDKIYGSNIIQKTDNRNKTYAGAEVNLMKWNKETEEFDFVQKMVTKEFEIITLEQWNTIAEEEREKLVDVVIDEEKETVTIPGAAFVDELEYGKYGYEEIKAPDGTIIYNGILDFYVTENSVVTTVNLVNLKELTKTGMINVTIIFVLMSLFLMLFKKYNKIS